MKHNIDEVQLKTWIEALRSGHYKQTKGKLQNAKGYCCLGVACEVLIPEPKKAVKYLKGIHPKHQPNAPEWLKDISANFVWDTIGTTNECITLIDLNDKLGYTFDEIADLLEAVYVYKVLEEDEHAIN